MKITELTRRRVFTKIVEFFPPSIGASKSQGQGTVSEDLNTKVQSLMDRIRQVESVSDAILIAQPKDSTKFHMSSLLTAVEVKRNTGIECIPTIPLRDYNRSGLMSQVLYGIYAGIENFCIVRGDPFSPHEDHYSGNVYDLARVADATRMVKEVVKATSKGDCCLLGPIDLSGELDERYLEMIRSRREMGVDVFVSQPFFGAIEDCLERLDKIKPYVSRTPVMHNIFALRGLDDALRLEDKFNWRITPKVKEQLKDGGIDSGLRFARERYLSLLKNRDKVDGVYISSRGVAEWALAILS